MRAGEREFLLLRRVLAGDVGTPVLVVDVHHRHVVLGLGRVGGQLDPPLAAKVALPVGAVVLAQDPVFFDGVRVVAVVDCVCHGVSQRGGANCVCLGHVGVDGRSGGVGVSVPQRPLVLEVACGDGLLVAVLPVVVLEGIEVVVLAELRHVVGWGVEEVGLVGGIVCQTVGGGRLEVGEVAHAREALPAGGGVDGCLRVRAVSAGRGDEVPLVVLARRRVGPGGLAVGYGCVARVDFDAEVADGEVDGSLGRCLGRDRCLLTRFVRGLVRVGAGDVHSTVKRFFSKLTDNMVMLGENVPQCGQVNSWIG